MNILQRLVQDLLAHNITYHGQLITYNIEIRIIMKNIKHIALSLLTIGFISCENEVLEDLRSRNNEEPVVFEEFTPGSLDVSTYVSLGNSLTAGFSDGALYRVAQENSTPAILAQQFSALVNGGTFTQPLMNDNIGGLLAGGSPIQGF